jgi:hypothetical protein
LKETIWKNPVFQDATYHRDDVRNAIQKAYADMGISAKGLPQEMKAYLAELQNYPSNAVPFLELQKTKQLANAILRDQNVLDKSGAHAISSQFDNIMTDVNSLHPDSLTNASTAPDLFDQARKATREYNALFGTKTTAPLAERAEGALAGQYKTQPEQFLDSVLKNPKDALGKLREIRALPNIDNASLDQAVSDYMVSKITQNNSKSFVTPKDIQSALKDPAYQQIVAETPGLQMRLNKIAKQSVGEQVINSFGTVLEKNDPAAISQYISKNKPLLMSAVKDPVRRQFIDQLEKSSNILKDLPIGKMTDRQLFNLLQNGDLFTILHGKSTGILAKGVAGGLSGKALGFAAPVAAGAEMLGAGAGAFGYLQKPTEIMGRLVYGTTQQEAMKALNRAAEDPAYMRLLMQKPTIKNSMTLLDSYKALPQTVAPLMAGARASTEPKKEPEMTEAQYNRMVREGKIKPQASGGRIGRATGGKAMMDPEREANKLISRVMAAKKLEEHNTEQLLQKDDTVIAKALAKANKDI